MLSTPLVVPEVHVRRRRTQRGQRIMLASFVAGLGPYFLVTIMTIFGSNAMTSSLHSLELLLLMLGYLLCPILFILGALVTYVDGRPAKATLRIDRDLSLLAGPDLIETIPRARIAEGIALPDATLELHLVNGDIVTITVPSQAIASEALARLGLDSALRRVTVPLRATALQFGIGCALVPISLVLSAWLRFRFGLWELPLESGTMLGLAAPLAIFVYLARPTEVTVGLDGVRLRSPLGERWIPRSELAYADVEYHRLVLVLCGPKEPVRVRGRAEQVQALARRISEVLAWRSMDEDAPPLAEVVDLDGQSLVQWRAQLAARAGAQGEAYRRAALPPETLFAVLEKPTAPADRRLAAALLLRQSEDPDAAPRIRLAAGGCANESMRVALERAAEDDLDEAALRQARR